MTNVQCFSIALLALISSAPVMSIDLGLRSTSCVGVTCENGGQCKLSNLGTASCVCPYGFSGNRCEIKIDLTPEPGQCPTLGSIGVCPYGNECNPAFSDHDCSSGYKCCAAFIGCNKYVCKKPDRVSCSNIQCQNDGSCVIEGGVAFCSCQAGYSGDRCEIATTRVEPGTCPVPSATTLLSCSPSECTDDSGCQIGRKCCPGPLSCGNKLCMDLSDSDASAATATDPCGGCASGQVCTTVGCLPLLIG